MPYGEHYKGLMEFVFDGEDGLIGFRMCWPNPNRHSRTVAGD